MTPFQKKKLQTILSGSWAGGWNKRQNTHFQDSPLAVGVVGEVEDIVGITETPTENLNGKAEIEWGDKYLKEARLNRLRCPKLKYANFDF